MDLNFHQFRAPLRIRAPLRFAHTLVLLGKVNHIIVASNDLLCKLWTPLKFGQNMYKNTDLDFHQFRAPLRIAKTQTH